LDSDGGGPFTPFGLGFIAAGESSLAWSYNNFTLCYADSDGDGQSNGLELGVSLSPLAGIGASWRGDARLMAGLLHTPRHPRPAISRLPLQDPCCNWTYTTGGPPPLFNTSISHPGEANSTTTRTPIKCGALGAAPFTRLRGAVALSE